MTDLSMVRGDTRTFDGLNLAYADTTLPNLAGASVSFIVRDLFTKDVDFDDSSGDASVTVDPEDTESAVHWRVAYPYNVQVTTAAGDVLTTQRGLFIILPEVEAL